ncbi:hypothetical protein Tco_1304666 [Tanacetum coccineum]
MTRQCTKPKRPRNSAWFKEKVILAEALESWVVLDEEQMAFLVDNGDTVTISQVSKEIPTLVASQTDDLDAFNYDCDEVPSASAVLMANFCLYDSAAPSDVPTHDTYLDNQIIDQSVKEMQYFERLIFTDTDIDITNDSNMISYEQYLKETKNAVVQDTSPSAQQEAMIMSVIEEITNQVEQHDALPVIDSEETLELAEESRLKMHAKQNDPFVKEKKVNITPIDYVALKKLSEHFILPRVTIMGLLPIEGYKGQFMGSSTHGQSYTSSNAPYWPIPTKNATLNDEEAQGKMGFALNLLTKLTQVSHHTVCHAGNPCELVNDPRVKICDPIIEEIQGSLLAGVCNRPVPRSFFGEL